MSKIIYQEEAQKKLLQGAEMLEKAVGSTLGPLGQNVGIRYLAPSGQLLEDVVVHDGVTVARSVRDDDWFIDFGISIVRQAAQKQVDEVGDGTTIVTILAANILRQVLKVISTDVNPMSLRKGLEQASQSAVLALEKLAKPVDTKEKIVQVATISAEDEFLGNLIGETVFKVGVDGVVTVDESKSHDTTVDHQEGMQFDKGYMNWQFITDPYRMVSSIEKPYILLTDQNINNLFEIQQLLEHMIKAGDNNLVVIGTSVSDSALGAFLTNKAQGLLNVNCVTVPGLEDKQKDYLQDIAILTGGRVISADAGMRLRRVSTDPNDPYFYKKIFGQAERVTSTKDSTLISGGYGDKPELDNRVNALRMALESEDIEFEVEKLRERIAKLTSGVAVIRVGGHTEVEMRERKERAIDAIAATQAAMRSGVVPGGEVALVKIADKIEHDEYKILTRALKKPFERLLTNAGLSPDIYLKQVENIKNSNGVDVSDGTVKDLIEAGIIDPLEVPKAAIKNAVSVAIQMMTTGAIIVPEKPKPNEQPRAYL